MIDIIIFWIIYFAALTIGYIIPEKLVKPFGFFDIIPFNCRKCLTSWTLALSYISWEIYDFKWGFTIAASIITIMTIAALIITDKIKQK